MPPLSVSEPLVLDESIVMPAVVVAAAVVSVTTVGAEPMIRLDETNVLLAVVIRLLPARVRPVVPNCTVELLNVSAPPLIISAPLVVVSVVVVEESDVCAMAPVRRSSQAHRHRSRMPVENSEGGALCMLFLD